MVAITVDEILAIEKWKAGYELFRAGQWLEILSFTKQGDTSLIWVNTYDDIANKRRTFLFNPGAEHRVRYEVSKAVPTDDK